MHENKNTLEYIINIIKKLNTEFSVETINQGLMYFVRIFFAENRYEIDFPRSLIDDFEIALERYRDSNYFHSLDYAIKFTIYIRLGKEGLLKDFFISNEIINEKRDWLKDYRVGMVLDAHMTEMLYKGLTDILKYFNLLLKKHTDLDLSEVKNHKEWILRLINYYDKNTNLNSTGVGIKNLQYLKAAAIAQILSFETRKRNEKNLSVIRAIDKEVYYIAEQLRKDPFLGIKPLGFIKDFKNMEA